MNAKSLNLPNHSDSGLPEPGRPRKRQTPSPGPVMSELGLVHSKLSDLQVDLESSIAQLRMLQERLFALMVRLGSR